VFVEIIEAMMKNRHAHWTVHGVFQAFVEESCEDVRMISGSIILTFSVGNMQLIFFG